MTWATAAPLQHINIRRRLAEVAHLIAQSIRAMVWSSTDPQSPPKPRNYPGHREAFIEDAAMAREMLRL
jgi:hypothetical protein